MTLKLFCAHCELEIEDPFEVLPTDAVASMSCERCRRQFWFSIVECERCANDVVRMWKAAPPAGVLSKLVCESCGQAPRLECDDEPEIHSATGRR
jgi:hypothetical protein